MIETGPTVYLPPIPPMIVVLIYSLFGNTWQAGYVFADFIFMTSSLMYALLPRIADRLGAGRPAGFVGGLIALVYPENITSRRVLEKCGLTHLETIHLWGIDLVRHQFERTETQ